jgi:cyanate permease
MAMGLGFTAGSMFSATLMSPMLGGWRNVLLLYGATSVGIGILWHLSRGQPSRGELLATYHSGVSFRRALSRVVYLKKVWLLGFILFGHMGCVQATLGYLPLYLRRIGWSAVTADGALALFNFASMLGTIPIALLSDRLGSRKAFLFITILLTAIGIGLLSVSEGTMVWVSLVLAGMVRDGFMAVLITTVTELDGVKATYAGTATGLVFTLSRLGSFIAPPIGNSLTGINLSLPFVFWSLMAAMAFLGVIFLKEKRS